MKRNMSFLRSAWCITLGLAVIWQIILTCVGFLFERHFVPLPTAAITPLSHSMFWDGGWFSGIVLHREYELNPAAPVFYPLFPALVAAVQAITFHVFSLSFAGLLVNTAALWLALMALFGIARQFVSNKYAWIAVALFLASPAAFFMHLFYAEAIFCALAFWAYLFALRKQWWYMGIALGLLTAVKIPAVLIIALCGLEYLRAHEWKIKKICNPALFSFALAPLGFIAYGIYLQVIRGDFFAMLHGYDATDDWSYHVFNPSIWEPWIGAAGWSVRLLVGETPGLQPTLVNETLPLLGLVLLGSASIYALARLKGRMIPVGIAGLLAIVFFSLNDNLTSVHRYLLPLFALYLIPVLLAEKYSWAKFVLGGIFIVCLELQAVLLMYFVSGRFAG